MTHRVAVVGGGISGIAAARRLAAAGLDVTLFESRERVGGMLRAGEFVGLPVDEGAEAFLVRVPAGVALATELGLPLVHPAAREAAVLLAGDLRPLPRTLLGVPLHPAAATAALSLAGAARAAADLVLPPTPYDGDISVGALLRRRLGDAAVDRLVEPLLGGVYAGRADNLSVATVLPQLHDPAGGSVVRRARAVLPPPSDAPVFASLAAGMGALPARAAETLAVRARTPVTGLRRTATGYAVELGSRQGRPAEEEVDAVVLALPTAPARRLLSGVGVPGLDTDYASVGIVTLAFPRDSAGLLRDPSRSGWLVPPVSGRTVKAVTVLSSKWAHLRHPDLVLVRASVGRHGEERDLQRDDAELTGIVAAEVAQVARVRGAPVASRVTRWGGALPQYTPGHPERVRRLRAALPPGLAVCGAGYDGVGIPACIASGVRAAETLAQWSSDHRDRRIHQVGP